MKTVLILGVNYNSYKELNNYLQSIERAARVASEFVRVDVWIGDNTTANQQPISIDYDYVCVRVFPYYQNLGYMGCAISMFHEISQDQANKYDFVFISNVDLLLSETFFIELNAIESQTAGWIVPSVYTIGTRKNENPFMLARPTRLKMFLLQMLYSFPLLYGLYEFIYRFRHKERNLLTNQEQSRPIYAGHGSIMIFTKQFVLDNLDMSFPGFMYGEEIYVAELVRQSHLTTEYYPQLVVNNIGNVSTKFLGNRRKCQMSKESLSAICHLFFEAH